MKNKLPRINWWMRTIIAGIGGILVFVYFIPDAGAVRIWSYIATVVLAFLPSIVKSWGIKFSDSFILAYYVFLIPAMILGIDFGLYKVFYPLDKIAHTFSGVLTAFGAKELLEYGKGVRKGWVAKMFCMGVVALVAVLWEVFEFSYDQIFHGNMQQLIVTGVEDTMWDMIMALIGAMIVVVVVFNDKVVKQLVKDN